MLIDEVVHYCDMMYSSFDDKCGCEEGICNHPSGKCSGSCYNCLYHIHFPAYAPENAKKEYDCPKMLYHYVCQYSYLYSTELLCAFANEWSFIKHFPYYHILSLGCGGCADLMAFDYLQQLKGFDTPIYYMGIDINDLWAPIHNYIEGYCVNNNIRYHTHYRDVFELLNESTVSDANIVVISYLLSYLYNTNQISAIDTLAKRIASRVVMKKDMPLLLIINDVNSYKRGRDFFSNFENAIRRCGLIIRKSEYKYFDTGNLYAGQRLGTPYKVNNVAMSVPQRIQEKYHAGTSIKQTVQLLVEVS